MEPCAPVKGALSQSMASSPMTPSVVPSPEPKAKPKAVAKKRKAAPASPGSDTEPEPVTSMDPAKQAEVLRQPRVHTVGRFWSVAKMHDKPLLRLQNLHRWFTDDVIARVLMPLARQDDRLSLRALDWLVTNYAKKKNIVLASAVGQPPLNIYREYRSMLTFWRRKYFDPFRRHQRIYFLWKEPRTPPHAQPTLEETTVGQLNFLHWAETSGIIQYARKNVQEIEADMATCMSQVKALKKEDKKHNIQRKRRELSKAPKRKCYIYPMRTQVNLEPEHPSCQSLPAPPPSNSPTPNISAAAAAGVSASPVHKS